MTSIAQRKTKLVIETSSAVRSSGKLRNVVVEAHPYHASIRLKGERHSLDLPWDAVYGLAAKLEAERVRREKKAKRGVR